MYIIIIRHRLKIDALIKKLIIVRKKSHINTRNDEKEKIEEMYITYFNLCMQNTFVKLMYQGILNL